jgi:superfamily II DNA or RNA helicase
MEKRLENFKTMNAPSPVHCLVQCAKLGEGYDQANISVAGICSKIGKVSRFAQFSGRAVRKQDHNNVEAALVEHISNKKDNVAHIITHALHNQSGHWSDFATQQGSGSFNPNADDDDDDDFDDNATTASDEVVLTQRTISDYAQPVQKKQKVEAAASSAETRVVHRYALARTTEKQLAVLKDETTLYDSPLKAGTTRRWTVENKTTGPGGAGPSNAA